MDKENKYNIVQTQVVNRTSYIEVRIMKTDYDSICETVDEIKFDSGFDLDGLILGIALTELLYLIASQDLLHIISIAVCGVLFLLVRFCKKKNFPLSRWIAGNNDVANKIYVEQIKKILDNINQRT